MSEAGLWREKGPNLAARGSVPSALPSACPLRTRRADTLGSVRSGLLTTPHFSLEIPVCSA